MGESLLQQTVSWKKVVAIIFAVLFTAPVVGCSAWVLTHTPVRDTQEEYERHLQLFGEEALLGKTKDEIRQMVGYPDGWAEKLDFNPYNASFIGREPHDDRIHYWIYASESSTGVRSELEVFYSDEMIVEEVIIAEMTAGNSLGDWMSRSQGVESAYNTHRD